MNTFTVYLTEWVNTEQVIDIAYDNKDMYTCTHPLAINVNIVVVDISMFKVIFWTTLHTNDNFTVFRFNQNLNVSIWSKHSADETISDKPYLFDTSNNFSKH